jgi:hypothetical protein
MNRFARQWKRLRKMLGTSAAPRRSPSRRPRLEHLEARLAPAHDTLATAIPLTFVSHTAQVSATLVQNQADLYAVTLRAGDEIAADASSPMPSGLASCLRVFDRDGHQVAFEENAGGDTTLTFDAPTAGVYYVGISANGNFGYDTRTTNSGHGATSAGDYGLTLNLGSVLVPESGSNFFLAMAQAVTGNTILEGAYVGGATAYYAFTATGTGRLTATVVPDDATVAGPRLTLYDSLGRLLIQSDATIGGAAQVVQHLRPGTYYLGVSPIHANSSVDQTYVLDTTFDAALPPSQPLPSGTDAFDGPVALTTGDFDHDGILDLATTKIDGYVSVFLGTGDGTFRSTGATYQVGGAVQSIAVSDFNEDGNLDLVTAGGDGFFGSVTVLQGNGDGTFRNTVTFDEYTGSHTRSVAVGDVDRDGHLDLVVNGDGDSLSVLMGNGDGTFQFRTTYFVGSLSETVALADLRHDGNLDIVSTNFGDQTVSVLLGNGDGTFQSPTTYDVGGGPAGLAIGYFDHDANLDLAVTDYENQTVAVFLGRSDGTFGTAADYALGSQSTSLTAADLNGDGRTDLVAVCTNDNSIAFLLGAGDGTFAAPVFTVVGSDPATAVVGDFDRNGKIDLAVTNDRADSISVLIGNGNATFQPTTPSGLQPNPASVAVGDFNHDGILDQVVANAAFSFATLQGDYVDTSVTVLLGNGDGTFRVLATYPVQEQALAVEVGDFNHDGSLDIVAVGGQIVFGEVTTVSVLLGRGDGTFIPATSYAVTETFPYLNAVAVGDINNDGNLDLVGSDYGADAVSTLLGNGDGTFRQGGFFATDLHPESVALADFNHDGKLDVASANQNNATVSVLLGNGDGTFGAPVNYSLRFDALSVRVADLNGDKNPDLVVGTENYINDTEVLLGNADGTFQPSVVYQLGQSTFCVALGDFNNDGKIDIAAVDSGNQLALALGNGDGTFRTTATFLVGNYALSVAAGDFNRDGNLDLVTVDTTDRSTSVLLGLGDGTFHTMTAAAGVPTLNMPLSQDLTGDGIADTVILDSSGNVLFRRGLPGRTNRFDPPVILNPGHLARDITLLRTPTGWGVAALDAGTTVSRYQFDPATGRFSRSFAFDTGKLPARIAADANGNLVVANGFDDTVTIAIQDRAGAFGTLTRAVGVVPSGIAFADLGNPFGLDIVVSDQVSGDFTVLRNDAGHAFDHEDRYRAGTGLFGIDDSTGVPTVSSQLQTVGLVAGRFTTAGRDDLVTLNRGADGFTLLPTQAGGTFANPSPSAYFTSQQASQVAAIALPGDPLSSVAVLMQDLGQIWIYRNTGNGPLSAPLKIDAGNSPTGFSVATVKGKLALLVGNKYGDILTLLYDGSTFAPDRADLKNLPLAVGTLAGSGRQYAVVADQQHDKVSLYYRVPGTNGFGAGIPITGQLPLLAPGAVQVFEVPGDKNPYLVVANSLSNDVLVYHYFYCN